MSELIDAKTRLIERLERDLRTIRQTEEVLRRQLAKVLTENQRLRDDRQTLSNWDDERRGQVRELMDRIIQETLTCDGGL